MAEKKVEGKAGARPTPVGHEDALAALQGLGNQEQGGGAAEPQAQADQGLGGEKPAGDVRPGSATGFAAMLAQGGGGGGTGAAGSGSNEAGSTSANVESKPPEAKVSIKTPAPEPAALHIWKAHWQSVFLDHRRWDQISAPDE